MLFVILRISAGFVSHVDKKLGVFVSGTLHVLGESHTSQVLSNPLTFSSPT